MRPLQRQRQRERGFFHTDTNNSSASIMQRRRRPRTLRTVCVSSFVVVVVLLLFGWTSTIHSSAISNEEEILQQRRQLEIDRPRVEHRNVAVTSTTTTATAANFRTWNMFPRVVLWLEEQEDEFWLDNNAGGIGKGGDDKNHWIGINAVAVPSHRLSILDDYYVLYDNDDEENGKDGLLVPVDNNKDNDRTIAPVVDDRRHRYVHECEYQVEWQTQAFPSCNSMHEISMPNHIASEQVQLLSMSGKIRSAWTWQELVASSASDHSANSSRAPPFVWKQLHLHRSFDQDRLEFHRIDATLLERLSASPHVTNIYGYCGQSVWTELAISIDEELTNATTPYATRFQWGLQLTEALHHLHSIDFPNATRPTVAYIDLKPLNLMGSLDAARVVSDDRNLPQQQPRLLLNDFNLARLLKWDPVRQEPCGYPIRRAWPIAPEIAWPNHTDTTYVDVVAIDNFRLGQMLLNLGTRYRHDLRPRSLHHVRKYLRRAQEETQTISYDWYQATLLLAACAATQSRPTDRPGVHELRTALHQAHGWIQTWNRQPTAPIATANASGNKNPSNTAVLLRTNQIRLQRLRRLFEIRAPIIEQKVQRLDLGRKRIQRKEKALKQQAPNATSNSRPDHLLQNT